ncbi:secretin receptor-like [Gigantopelta aegis]|uniref:secretin receptor-like n=1 Tax=Gigantopelta aegis TaxID=1735272 RepID=UPI001B8894D5|nr:secretin receptor-like [Gigantopelta aegis]
MLGRLKSKSNSLHINLFFAFILRASFSFIKGALFVKHVGLSIDIKYASDGSIMFDQAGTHWVCRMMVAVFLYSICASQMWIFMEGLYLHNLIYRTLSTERRGVKIYIIIGWLSPLTFLIPWIIVKSTVDNYYCWTIGGNKDYFWILHGPLLATVVINFVFFLDILRVMCGRIRTSSRHMGKTKYRRLAKFVLVLIPLFGIMYIVFHVAFPARFQSKVDIMHLYIEMTYNSIQGFILALLFCFLNEEVHRELKRMWLRQKSRRGDGTALTRSFVMSSFKQRPSSSRVQNGRVFTKAKEKEDIFNKIKSGARNCFRIPETSSSTAERKHSDVIDDIDTIFKDKCDNRNSGTAL